jgi:hypothetical protein
MRAKGQAAPFISLECVYVCMDAELGVLSLGGGGYKLGGVRNSVLGVECGGGGVLVEWIRLLSVGDCGEERTNEKRLGGGGGGGLVEWRGC